MPVGGMMPRADSSKRPSRKSTAQQPRGRKTYSDEFKADAVERVRGGQSLHSVAQMLGVSRTSLRTWVDAAPAPRAKLAAAAASGDRKAYLVALRDQIAETIEAGIAARDLPPNARLLNETMRELEEIEAREAEEAADAADAEDEDWDPEAL
ncbi:MULTISPECIES: transposase [unclassified Agrococcus]|uniref:transposase n=1 Tax=unclassified Agrococcus TaxID=2615065 RepID=UPI00361739DC